MWAVCHTLLSGFIKFSANPLASGPSGLTTMVLTPAHFIYIWYSWLPLPLNGGPQSVLTESGNPCVEKTQSICGMTAWALVLLVNSTSGYLVYSSITTSRYSPLGSGPQKSISVHCHGRSGSLVGFNGSRVGTYVVA